MTKAPIELAIIGAGPYGLAAAAHLRPAGVEFQVFGETMALWQRQIRGIRYLRSSWNASHIADPDGALTLDEYQRACGRIIPTPIPLRHFIEYGHWFQRQVVPDLDCRRVARLEPAEPGFILELEDGETLRAGRVVVAAGIGDLPYFPPAFAGLPRTLASHVSQHPDLTAFAGQRVAVIGSGQEAMQAAVRLGAAGASPELILPGAQVRWLGRSCGRPVRLKKARSLLDHPSGLGKASTRALVVLLDGLRSLSHLLSDCLANRLLGQAASAWQVPYPGFVSITRDRRVVRALAGRNGLTLLFDDGNVRSVNHALLATGYRVDVARYPFLGRGLVRALATVHGYPLLKAGFESSVAGLHFLGAPAAWSFGPTMLAVAGTAHAAGALAACLR